VRLRLCFVAIAAFSIATAAFSQSEAAYAHIASNDDEVVVFDTTSTEQQGDIRRAWVTTAFRKPDTETCAHACSFLSARVEIDCKAKRMRLIGVREFDAELHPLTVIDRPFAWDAIDPNGLGILIYKSLCDPPAPDREIIRGDLKTLAAAVFSAP
jgi:hypothetical protein